MNRITATVAIAAVMWVSATVRAGSFYSGNELYDYCFNIRQLVDAPALCGGYILGIADALTEGGKGNVISGYTACIPAGVAGGQAQDVVKRYLAQHPEQRHFTAAGLVVHAVAEAFPCR